MGRHHSQKHQIDSLIAMTRYSEAMQVYEDATKLFFDELGLHPSQEMLERAHMMAERLSQSTEEFADIWRRLSCRLGEAILQSLRRGDFFTKYSMLQHLVVLTGIRREDCAKVSAKIEAAFYKKAKKGTYKFGFSVLSVEEINRIEASGIAWMR